VPGWFYNLGITGLRAQLVTEEPKALLVKYVFPQSPADPVIKVDDWIVGVEDRKFQDAHQNGYGMNVFGAKGPVSEFAMALETCQAASGKLRLTIRRGDKTKEVILNVGKKNGSYSSTFPNECKKSDRLLKGMLQYLVAHQKQDGSFGDPVDNLFAPLALLASRDKQYLQAVERNVRYHCQTIAAKDTAKMYGLPNWSYMAAAIVLSEYYLATKQDWVLPALQQIHDFIAAGQYLDMSQINPKAKESHPHSFPKGPQDSHGGWGHNPGFEGYGPIAMLTGQGALAYALMSRCGIKIDRTRQDAAYDFLKRATGANGYVWYGDELGGGPNDWADMGRTGAAGIANFLSPFPEPDYEQRAKAHSKVIGDHPQSFPDTHGSPLMGMGFAALAANLDPKNFRQLMDANRYWFTLSQCADGSFYYQPNRDNAGYGAKARVTATATVAFIFSIPKKSLVITGKSLEPKKKLSR
jgi:hypothetical protein